MFLVCQLLIERLYMFRHGAGGESLDRELRGPGVADTGDVEQGTSQVALGGGPGGHPQWGRGGTQVKKIRIHSLRKLIGKENISFILSQYFCSVLGGNAGSLVGVAISASLLPPAVNAGFFWCLSMLIAATQGHIKMFGPRDSNMTFTEYKAQYSDSQALEAFILGVVSLALTILNIICIIITGIAILRLKEVTPDKIPQTFSDFWKTDVRSRRGKYNRLDEEDALLEEGLSFGLDGTIIQDLFDEAQKDEDMKQIKRWVVTTQNMKKMRKPYSYTNLNENKVVR